MDALTKPQRDWLAEHPDYVLMSSWGGEYQYSGVLFPTGLFDRSSIIIPMPGCIYIGERQRGTEV